MKKFDSESNQMTRRSFNKTPIYILSFVSIVLFVVVIALGAVLGTEKSAKNREQNGNEQLRICTTKACIKAANGMLQNMNTSADPCEDFNEFACGNFIKTQRIPDDSTNYGSFSILRNTLSNVVSELLEESEGSLDIQSTKNAKRLYRSCLDEEKIEQNGEKNFMNFIQKEFGDWPALTDNFIEDSFDPMESLVKFRLYGLRQLVDVRVEVNPKNSSRYVLKVRQPTWFLNKDYYNSSIPSSVKVIDAYKKYAKTFLTYLNKDKEVSNDVIDRMYTIERELGVLIRSESERRNSTFINMTIKELNERVPNFDWTAYIANGIYKDIKDVTLNEQETILVEDIDYLKKATEYYQGYVKMSKADFKNFLIWAFAKDRSGLLPKRYKDARLDFDKVYSGNSVQQARSITCSNLVLNRMEYAAGRMYVSKYFDNKSKQDATNMINYIRKAFKEIIIKNAWMDEVSKKKALEKADFIDPKIGYPDFTYNDTYLNDYYKDYEFSPDNYLENSVKIYKTEAVDAFMSLRDFRDKTEWISGPAVVNAFYSPPSNQICFPAGILQAPFYDSQQPNYLNFGGIGSVIGHEITHGFDDRGRLYDKDGTYFADGEEGLWSPETIANYKVKAKCIIDQYTAYFAKQVGLNLIGSQTQGENIADNGGVKESFEGYQRWINDNGQEPLLPGLDYNQNQLFFINYAQVWCSKYRDQALINQIKTGVHSPGEFRIRGPISNFDEFAKAFKCKSGSSYNPIKKCTVW